MLFRWIASLFLLIISTGAIAQNSRLSGKVVNDKNEPLSGVSINTNTGIGTTSDVDGNFALNLLPGKKYELSFSTVGYATKILSDVEVIAGQANELSVLLTIAAKDLGGVTVVARANARRETVNSLIAFQKNTNTVASVISAEAIRRSPDKNLNEHYSFCNINEFKNVVACVKSKHYLPHRL